MPNNYILLDRIELNASAASVTFDNIPQSGYTDLKVVASIRDTSASTQNNVIIRMNSVTTSQSVRTLYGAGSGAPASYSDTPFYAPAAVGNNATANTFGSLELYIPNYASTSASKSMSLDTVTENNGTTGWQSLNAGLYASNSAITSIQFVPNGAVTFMTGSTFSLYGLAQVGTTPAIAPKADGGNVIENDGTYWYHRFLTNGTFTPQTRLNCDVLVVGGGGGDGGGISGITYGSGGAGAIVTQVSNREILIGSYAVTVGAGGAAAVSSGAFGGTGVTSSIALPSAISATGGGGGFNVGGGANDGRGGANALFSGGNSNIGGGGAAGAGGNGGGASGLTGGNGGAGVTPTILGTAIAGGGAGGGSTSGSATAGGGTMSTAPSTFGAGAGGSSSFGIGASGVVIIRYPIAS